DRIERAAAAIEVGDVLVAEVLDRRGHRAGRAVAESTKRAAEDVLGEVEQRLDVLLVAHTTLEAFEDLHVPEDAFAAWRALTAGLVRVELTPAQHGPHHAGRLVEELKCGCPKHRGVRRWPFEIERDVEVFGGEQRS